VVQDPTVRGLGTSKKENLRVDREESISPKGILVIDIEGDTWRKDNRSMFQHRKI
jgi:hypothetical protein